MTLTDRPLLPRDGWMPALTLLAVVLLLVAALLNGVGAVGVAGPAHSGNGHYVDAGTLAPVEQIPFRQADRALERLRFDDSGHPEQFEAYEPVLQALAEALPARSDERAMARVRMLLSKSLPAPAADELKGVLPGFLAYQRAEQSLLGLRPGGPRNAEEAYVHLRMQDALRRATLGAEVADRLYRTSYRMTETHLRRQLLMERKDLDDEEKQRLIREQMEALAAQPHDGGKE